LQIPRKKKINNAFDIKEQMRSLGFYWAGETGLLWELEGVLSENKLKELAELDPEEAVPKAFPLIKKVQDSKPRGSDERAERMKRATRGARS